MKTMSEHLSGARPSRLQLQRPRWRPARVTVSPMDLQEVVWSLQRCGGDASEARLKDELASLGITGAGQCRRLITAAVTTGLIRSSGGRYSLRE